MNLAYYTSYDPLVPPKHLGNIGLHSAGYWLLRALQDLPDFQISTLGPLNPDISLGVKILSRVQRHIFKGRYLRHLRNQNFENLARLAKLKMDTLTPDMVLCPENFTLLAAWRSKIPTLLWTDAPVAGLMDFYPYYSKLSKRQRQRVYESERRALDTCKKVIFTSHWAAKLATEIHGLAPQRLHVIPWGANHQHMPDTDTIAKDIKGRNFRRLELLFIGVDWGRKGGERALRIASELTRRGLDCRLTLVGSKGMPTSSLEAKVEIDHQGYLSRYTADSSQKLDHLLRRSHFLLLPSTAETFGHVFCEASSFGVPSLAYRVGGVGEVILDGVNGYTLDLSQDEQDFSDLIQKLFADPIAYESLALSSHQRFLQNLNWPIAAGRFHDFLQTAR